MTMTNSISCCPRAMPAGRQENGDPVYAHEIPVVTGMTERCSIAGCLEQEMEGRLSGVDTYEACGCGSSIALLGFATKRGKGDVGSITYWRKRIELYRSRGDSASEADALMELASEQVKPENTGTALRTYFEVVNSEYFPKGSRIKAVYKMLELLRAFPPVSSAHYDRLIKACLDMGEKGHAAAVAYWRFQQFKSAPDTMKPAKVLRGILASMAEAFKLEEIAKPSLLGALPERIESGEKFERWEIAEYLKSVKMMLEKRMRGSFAMAKLYFILAGSDHKDIDARIKNATSGAPANMAELLTWLERTVKALASSAALEKKQAKLKEKPEKEPKKEITPSVDIKEIEKMVAAATRDVTEKIGELMGRIETLRNEGNADGVLTAYRRLTSFYKDLFQDPFSAAKTQSSMGRYLMKLGRYREAAVELKGAADVFISELRTGGGSAPENHLKEHYVATIRDLTHAHIKCDDISSALTEVNAALRLPSKWEMSRDIREIRKTMFRILNSGRTKARPVK